MQKDIIELLVVVFIALVPGILATIWYFKVSTKQYLAHPNIKLALGLCNSIAVLLLIL